MRVKVEVDAALLARAMEAAGGPRVEDVVEEALHALIARAGQRRISEFKGKLPWDGDLAGMRRTRVPEEHD